MNIVLVSKLVGFAKKILITIVLLLMITSIMILAIKYYGVGINLSEWSNESFIPTSPVVKTVSCEKVIEDYLVKYPSMSVVRGKAIGILREYLNKTGIILQDRFSISAGSSRRIKLELYNDIIYELTVSVSGSCIGKCDIRLKLVDEQNRLALLKSSSGSTFINGRYSYLRISFVLNPLEESGTYYLYLDNSYSIFTSKNVYVLLKSYYPEYAFNDEYFKIFAIGHWVSKNVKYVSDPLVENEYVAPPNETLRVMAGDCDDFAVLLATLYRSVGLKAMVGLIDTDGDDKVDHATALVYLDDNADEALEHISKWAYVLGIDVDGISYFNKDKGILLIVDPPMALDKDNPWHVLHRPYRLIKTINP